MFGVGLQFHIEELLAVRRVAIPGAIAQSVVATALGALLAQAFGWDWSAGLIFGMALAVASTVVLVRVLADNNDLHTQAGHIAVGWLVVEDLFTVVALVLLPALLWRRRETDTPLWLAARHHGREGHGAGRLHGCRRHPRDPASARLRRRTHARASCSR